MERHSGYPDTEKCEIYYYLLFYIYNIFYFLRECYRVFYVFQCAFFQVSHLTSDLITKLKKHDVGESLTPHCTAMYSFCEQLKHTYKS